MNSSQSTVPSEFASIFMKRWMSCSCDKFLPNTPPKASKKLVEVERAAVVGVGLLEGGLQLHQLVEVDAVLHRHGLLAMASAVFERLACGWVSLLFSSLER